MTKKKVYNTYINKYYSNVLVFSKQNFLKLQYFNIISCSNNIRWESRRIPEILEIVKNPLLHSWYFQKSPGLRLVPAVGILVSHPSEVSYLFNLSTLHATFPIKILETLHRINH